MINKQTDIVIVKANNLNLTQYTCGKVWWIVRTAFEHSNEKLSDGEQLPPIPTTLSIIT